MSHVTLAVSPAPSMQGSFSLSGLAGLAVLGGVAVLAAAVVVLVLIGPWRRGEGSVADRLRIGAAVTRYDLWLDMRGVDRRRRRDLRRELRGNLVDAAAHVGARDAVRALGSVRHLARDVAAGAGPKSGPRWADGAIAAGWTFGVVAAAELLATLGWASAAEASGAARVQGSLPLFPGSLAQFARDGGGLSLTVQPGWLVIAAVGAAYLVRARPWRLLGRRVPASSQSAAA